MVRFSKAQRVTMGAVIGVGLFNPFTVAVLDEYFKLVYLGVFLLCVGWVVVYVLYNAFKPQTVNIPGKTAKTQKAGKLIAT